VKRKPFLFRVEAASIVKNRFEYYERTILRSETSYRSRRWEDQCQQKDLYNSFMLKMLPLQKRRLEYDSSLPLHDPTREDSCREKDSFCCFVLNMPLNYLVKLTVCDQRSEAVFFNHLLSSFFPSAFPISNPH
jgi:hypothetical protein